MRRIILTALTLSILPLSAHAQTAFWNYDENNNETLIPAQCDGQFDETHGGVFMPSPDELYDQGELFLLEKGETRNNAGYCLLSAAIQGNVKAQYRVAQLYNKGLVLPQNDIVAYRWAFLASLNGSKEAEQLALTLEQVLSADEIKLATDTIEPILPTMTQEKSAELQAQEELLAEKRETLESINKEIDDLLGVHFEAPPIINPAEQIAQEKAAEEQSNEKASSKVGGATVKNTTQPQAKTRARVKTNAKPAAGAVFNESDRMKK